MSPGSTMQCHNSHLFSTSNSLSQQSLTSCCEICDVSAVNFAHFGYELVQEWSVHAKIAWIEIKLVERVFVASLF